MTVNRRQVQADRIVLAEAFAVFAPPKSRVPRLPLAIGISRDLLAAELVGRDSKPISHARLKRALSDYCRGVRYHLALVAGGTRYGLDGQPAGDVAEAHQRYHQSWLARLPAHHHPAIEGDPWTAATAS